MNKQSQHNILLKSLEMLRKGGYNIVPCFLLYWLLYIGKVRCLPQPHIIFIIADDLGWNDVSFRGSNEIPTPNIDALAYNGIVLDRHYTQPACTPSRTALLTGKYPIRFGLENVIIAGHADGIPPGQILLPQLLQKLGYVTRLIGKWHVGYATTSMTPTRRGFHSHFGYLNGFVGFRNGAHAFLDNITGFDCYRNLRRSKDEVVDKYLTDVYTKEAVNIIRHHGSSAPLFLVISHLAPHAGAIGLGNVGVLEVRDEAENSKKYKYISNPDRRLYAGMMEALDSSVGDVIEALDSRHMLQNSVVVFISDNGGPTSHPRFPKITLANTASNWPLRGLKMSPFEGGVRGVAVAWSPRFKQLGRTSDSYMHISDWLPTLYSAAGGDAENLKDLDGVNQWNHLVDEKVSRPRRQFLVNINQGLEDWAVVKDEWKLIKVNASHRMNFTQVYVGESGRYDTQYSIDLVLESPVSKILLQNQLNKRPREEYLERRINLDLTVTAKCADRITAATGSEDYMVPLDRCSEAPCLFNIQQDPCEFKNVAAQHPSIVGELYELFQGYNSEYVKNPDSEFDPAAHPDNWGGYWAPWLDKGKRIF